jgi:ABC-2 type transport system ATP-binding protein
MPALSVVGLTKRFGRVSAVDDLSFDVAAGTVTGFLGPNGAGKTTTLRMLLGLVRPTSGEALVHGRRYVELERPSAVVGAVLEAAGFHPGRTARDHLRVLATAARLPMTRVDEVLDEVELASAARRRVGGFSLGMRQRLGIAAALLGDPEVLVLDEPTNGLDPAGVHWLRALMRERADRGGTVLVSSHLLAELALAADHVVIIKDGRSSPPARSPRSLRAVPPCACAPRKAERLRQVLAARGVAVQRVADEEVLARDVDAAEVGQAVAAAGLLVYEMRVEQPDLEAAFLALTSDAGRGA